ncbi:DNA-directed RNA polymerase [Caballeronia sp. LZ034LL]|uniref:DNA-directed RNA polymerase n=1 Tax=Caballeronia sp. LZ034LL TaxID=3038567 RepID=UPI0028572F97|nr:DNA-directed RNA polymerase [Caballeronia sp. LZ034LL]MDR5839360.1 hypothetical protein [Caballeronia sp. LZ034LL]
MQKFTGLQYLKIDIASNYGLDKKTWDERLAWFEAHKDQLHEMLATAETPALYFAGVQAYEKALAGEACGYPISLDATSSGLQILAALCGDRLAAQLCNVVSTGSREDAYTGIYQTMLDKIGVEGRIKRSDVKQAVMTALYGSQAIPKLVFGEGGLLTMFYETMKEVAPYAWELNEAFLSMWNPNALINSWVLPDNFHVHVKVMGTVTERIHFLDEPIDVTKRVNMPVEEGRSLGANTIHSIDGMIVREMNRRCNYDPAAIAMVWDALQGVGTAGSDEDDAMVMKLWAHFKESGYLSARILDHLRVDNIDLVDEVEIRELLLSLPKKPFQIMTIHDCFRCLPNYGNDLREQYNLQLALIAKSRMLQFLVRQIMERTDITVESIDPEMWQEVLDTEYALS